MLELTTAPSVPHSHTCHTSSVPSWPFNTYTILLTILGYWGSVRSWWLDVILALVVNLSLLNAWKPEAALAWQEACLCLIAHSYMSLLTKAIFVLLMFQKVLFKVINAFCAIFFTNVKQMYLSLQPCDEVSLKARLIYFFR